MATTNIHLATTVTGKPVTESEISEGLEIIAPGIGGNYHYICRSVDEKEAIFTKKDPQKDEQEWSVTFRMEFNKPDLSLADIEELHDIFLDCQQSDNVMPYIHRVLVERAALLGYVTKLNYDQIEFTGKGIDAIHKLPDVKMYVYRTADYDGINIEKGTADASIDGALHSIYRSSPNGLSPNVWTAIQRAVQSVGLMMNHDDDALRIVAEQRATLAELLSTHNEKTGLQTPEALLTRRPAPLDGLTPEMKGPSGFSVVMYRAHEYHKSSVGFREAYENGAVKNIWDDEDTSSLVVLQDINKIVNDAASCIDGNADIRVGVMMNKLDHRYNQDVIPVFVDIELFVREVEQLKKQSEPLEKKEITSGYQVDLSDYVSVDLHKKAFDLALNNCLLAIKANLNDVHHHFVEHAVSAFYEAAEKGHTIETWESVINLLADLSPAELGDVDDVKDLLARALPYEYFSSGNAVTSDFQNAVKDAVFSGLYNIAIDKDLEDHLCLTMEEIKPNSSNLIPHQGMRRR